MLPLTPVLSLFYQFWNHRRDDLHRGKLIKMRYRSSSPLVAINDLIRSPRRSGVLRRKINVHPQGNISPSYIFHSRPQRRRGSETKNSRPVTTGWLRGGVSYHALAGRREFFRWEINVHPEGDISPWCIFHSHLQRRRGFPPRHRTSKIV